MKIIVFTTQFHLPSGAEKLSIQLAEELIVQGYDVLLLSMYGKDNKEIIDAETRLKTMGIKEIAYLNLPLNPGVADIIMGIVRLRNLINREQYDLIETSLLGPTIIASWASLFLPVRVLSGIHAIYKKEVNNTRKHKLLRLTTKLVTSINIYAISHAAADAWSSYASIPKGRIQVVYNAVDDAFFNAKTDSYEIKKQLQIPSESKIILFVGSLLMYKGIDTLVDAAAPILEELNTYLVFVGEGNKSEDFYPADKYFYRKFYSDIENATWKNSIKFVGTRDDVPSIMASSNVLVHPTRTEGFGLVIAEALAVGLPVIATNVGGIPEVVEGTKSIIVPPDNPDNLRDAIKSVFSYSEKELEEMIQLGRIKAENYRMNNRVESLVEIAVGN